MSSQKKNFYDWLVNAVTTAQANTPLYRIQTRFTPFEYSDEEDFGLCLSNVVSNPSIGLSGADEFDCRLIITSYARIKGERDNRQEAYEKAKAIILEIVRLMREQRGCDHIGQLIDDIDDQLSPGQKHAVNNLYVVLNRTGDEMPGMWR